VPLLGAHPGIAKDAVPSFRPDNPHQPRHHAASSCAGRDANPTSRPRYAKQAVDQQFARWVMLHVQSNPLPICTHPFARADQGASAPDYCVHGAVDATFAAFGMDAVYTSAGGEPVSGVIARRPDTAVGFGEPGSTPRLPPSRCGRARSRARTQEISSAVGGETFVVQGEPERRDPERLVWTLDAQPA
jgi:Phage major capsid protein E